MPDFITTLQDALVDGLASLDSDQVDGYLRRRAAFNGSSVEEILRVMEVQTPAVIVSFTKAGIAGGPFLKRDDVTLNLSLWCASSSLRGQEAGAQGSGVTGEPPGAFQIAEDVIQALRHERFSFAGRDTLGVVFSAAEWIGAEAGLAVVRLDCSVSIPQIDWNF